MNNIEFYVWVLMLLVTIVFLAFIGLVLWHQKSNTDTDYLYSIDRGVDSIHKTLDHMGNNLATIDDKVEKECENRNIERIAAGLNSSQKHENNINEQIREIEKRITLIDLKLDLQNNRQTELTRPCMSAIKETHISSEKENSKDILAEILTAQSNSAGGSMVCGDDNSGRHKSFNKALGKSGKLYTEEEINSLIGN